MTILSPNETPVMTKKWYTVQAFSGFEEKVKLALEERIRREGLEALFGDILVPAENVTETRGTKTRQARKTFYPGYVFVEMELNDQSWYLVRNTPKVGGFIGGQHPVPVPAHEIAAVSQQVEEGAARPKPRVTFEPGDQVRVIDGAFANFTGSIEEVNLDKHKLKVLVSIFGRATPLELDFAQVEKNV